MTIRRTQSDGVKASISNVLRRQRLPDTCRSDVPSLTWLLAPAAQLVSGLCLDLQR